jgi:hypothetical protein
MEDVYVGIDTEPGSHGVMRNVDWGKDNLTGVLAMPLILEDGVDTFFEGSVPVHVVLKPHLAVSGHECVHVAGGPESAVDISAYIVVGAMGDVIV